MAAITQLAARPGQGEDSTEKSKYRTVGLGLAVMALMLAMIGVIGNLVAAGGIDEAVSYRETLAWTFGVTIFAFGTAKIAIGIVLMGIIVRLWFRVDSIKEALVALRGHGGEPGSARGDITTDWGAATITDEIPEPLFIHRMARTMWRPMLAMGAMALTVGLISSFVWAGKTPGTVGAREAQAFTQGVEFLGEALLLSGIAFLLGTIMAGLRDGGGEVQQSLGLPVTTLKMPTIAKAFVGLMMMGMMIGILQFILYLVALGNADDPASFSSWLNWLGPFRELSLGLILAGIVLALVTIGNVLSFQFDRIKTIMRTGV